MKNARNLMLSSTMVSIPALAFTRFPDHIAVFTAVSAGVVFASALLVFVSRMVMERLAKMYTEEDCDMVPIGISASFFLFRHSSGIFLVSNSMVISLGSALAFHALVPYSAVASVVIMVAHILLLNLFVKEITTEFGIFKN